MKILADAVTGGVAGAAIGAAVSDDGDRLQNAAIGGAVGTVAGALIGQFFSIDAGLARAPGAPGTPLAQFAYNWPSEGRPGTRRGQ